MFVAGGGGSEIEQEHGFSFSLCALSALSPFCPPFLFLSLSLSHLSLSLSLSTFLSVSFLVACPSLLSLLSADSRQWTAAMGSTSSWLGCGSRAVCEAQVMSSGPSSQLPDYPRSREWLMSRAGPWTSVYTHTYCVR